MSKALRLAVSASVLISTSLGSAFAQTPSAPGKPAANAEFGDLVGSDKEAPSQPAPRTSDGHPELTGFWKGNRATKPVGNIGKDLPGFKLPLTPVGEAALQHNLTATIDPESLCILGGIPRHNASGLPFMIVQNSSYVTFLYFL
jgi:hypothetical protein